MLATRSFWLAALALILISLVPFFLVDVPAVLDYPNHLARIFVLAHPGDPFLSRFYAPNWRILPNLGFDVLGMALLKILPVHIGGRVLLAVSMMAPIWGVFAYARAAFGKLGLWPLASIIAAFNGIFFLGFMNFLLAIGLAFAAAGAWLSLRRSGRNEWCLIMGSLSSVLLFFCHLFGVLLFALLIGCQEIAHAREKGLSASPGWLRAFAMIIVALTPALFLYIASPLSDHAAAPGDWDWKHKLWDLFVPFMTTSKPLTLVTALVVLPIPLLRRRQTLFAPGTGLALTILALLYLVAPASIKGGTLIDLRLSLIMGLLLFAGMDPQIPPAGRKWAFAAIVLLVGTRSFVTGLAWYDHRRDLADLRTTLALVPSGARVLAVQGENAATDPETPARNLPDILKLDSHLPALLVIERRAFWPHMFAQPAQQPLVVKPPYDQMADPSGDSPLWQWMFPSSVPGGLATLLPHMAHWRDDFDYVLLIDRPVSIKAPKNFIPVRSGSYTALWRLEH